MPIGAHEGEKIVSRVRLISLLYTHSGTRTAGRHHTYNIYVAARESRVKLAEKKINNEKRVDRARAFKNRAGKKNSTVSTALFF